MSRLLELQEEIQNTSAAIALQERAVVANPTSYGLLINQRGLRRRFTELEEAFKLAAEERQVDVCRYRMFQDFGTPNALASTLAIADFQKLVSLVYDALSSDSGRKERARVSATSVKETSFGIGYVFPSSIGFVLTLPADRLLFDDQSSPVDAAISTIFGAAASRSDKVIAALSKQLGPSVVRAIYKWIDLHLSYNMGMDIEWARGSALKSKLFLQRQELAEMRDIIERTSERIDDDVVIEGTYVGGDVKDETIHIEVPDAGDIHAVFHELFNQGQLPREYRVPIRATMIKRTKIHLATEKEDIRYLVTKIEDLS